MKCRNCKCEFVPTDHQIKKHDYLCLPCRKAYGREWRRLRQLAGKPISGTKTWAPEKRAAWKKRYYSDPKVKEAKARAMRKYAKDPVLYIRRRARWFVARLKTAGKLKSQPCAECGAEPTEAHHKDYSQPLLIVWLCRSCHGKLHNAKAEGRE